MNRVKEDRSFLVAIGLSIITCGIYGIIFYWQMFNDLNTVCRVKENDDSQNTPNYIVYALLTLVTCGIYAWYWMYKQGNRIQRTGEKYGERIDENGTSMIMWCLLGGLVCGLGIIMAHYLLIKNINTLSKCYNREYADREGLPQKEAGRGYYSDSQASAGWAQEENRTQFTMGTPTIGIQKGTIVCTRGAMQGAEFPMNDGEVVTLGRDSAVCNIILPDMDISRRHCTVQFNGRDNCYYVTDYSSLGVRLNGTMPLEKNAAVSCPRGSKIVLGNGNNEFMLQ